MTVAEATAVTVLHLLMNDRKDEVEPLLNTLSRDELWYLKENAEEMYSMVGGAFETRDDG